MLSTTPIKGGASGAAQYYETSERGGEYYENGHDRPGEWAGSGAATLGLSGQLSAGQLEALLSGHHPGTGEALAGNAGPEHRPGYDLTFSAPKSVSAIWAIADGETRARLEQAHQQAIRAALEMGEQTGLTVARHGKAGHERIPTAEGAGAVFALYQHGTSRAGDPDLHTHAVLASMDASGRSIDLDTRQKLMIGAGYRVELAAQLAEMGYQIERDRTSFEIAGVSRDLQEQWSTRRAEITAALSERGVSGAKAAEVAALATRSEKQHHTPEQLAQQWAEQAAAHGLTAETARPEALAELAAQQQTEHEPAEPITPARLLAQLTERASTITEPQLIAAALQAQQGQAASLAKARAFVEACKSEAVQLIDRHNQIRYTTREMLQIEQGIAASAQRRAAESNHVIDPARVEQIAAKMGMREEQKQATLHMTGTGGISAVEGMAGAGKTYALAGVRELYDSEGYTVRGAALAGKAADGLQQEAGIPSQTLHSLLADLDSGRDRLTEKTVLVIDEAGMIGSRQYAALLYQAEAAGAKIIAVGDTQQLQPIDAGGAQRAIVNEIGAAEMREIRRQHDEIDRQTVHQFARGEAAQALQTQREQGRLHVHDDRRELMQQIAQGWHTTHDPARPGESLMIAGTRRDVAQLNAEARALQAQAGALTGPAITNNGAEFQAGDRMIFKRNDREIGIKNGTLATIEKIEYTAVGITIHAQTDSGKIVQFDPQQYEHYQHGYAVTAHASQGVTVDRAYLLYGQMTDREWAYVANSRARIETHAYADTLTAETLERDASRSRQKELSLDHEIVERRHEGQQHEQTNEQEREIDGDHQPHTIDEPEKNAAHEHEPVHEHEVEADAELDFEIEME